MFPLTALFDVGMKVLDKFIPDPEAKAKAQQELLKMQQEGKLAELQADMNEQLYAAIWSRSRAGPAVIRARIDGITLWFKIASFTSSNILEFGLYP